MARAYTQEEFGMMTLAMGPFSTSEQRLIATVEKVSQEKQDLAELLAEAVARVEIANREGNPILSAWVAEAKRAIA
jgi:hypothetical protein